jgi:hypothetical protein
MTLFIATIGLWLLLVLVAFRTKHYAFSLFFSLVGLYELSPLAVYFLTDDYWELLVVARFLLAAATPEIVTTHSVGLLVLFATSGLVYLIFQSAAPSAIRNASSPSSLYLIPLAIFVFGVISVATGAGAARAQDYQSTSGGFGTEYQHPAVFYGRALYVVAITVMMVAIAKRRLLLAALCGLALLPITLELFIAGRRQAFAPTGILLALVVLYASSMKRKMLLFLSVVTLFLSISTIQFIFRSDYYIEDAEWRGWSLALLPTVGEFVAVGTTSVRALSWSRNEGTDSGLHLLIGALNATPYFKLGSFLEEERLLKPPSIDFDWVAPRGALSMSADLLLSFGASAYLILGVLLGISLHYCHQAFVRFGSRQLSFTTTDILAVSLAATFLIQYRSGVVVAFNNTVYITLLYFALVLPMLALEACLRPRGSIPRSPGESSGSAP